MHSEGYAWEGNRVQKWWLEIRWGKLCIINNLFPVTEIYVYLFESMNMG